MIHKPVRYHTGAFPPKNLDWSKLIPLLGNTSAAIARYDGTLQGTPNPRLLLAPLTTQEAVLSSRIEGTQATMGEVLEFEAGGGERSSPEKANDIYEVVNYRSAIREAETMMQEVPLSQRVLLAAHKTLLSGVRGQNKAPGQYRRIPNWLGPLNCKEEEARFIPIGAGELPQAMGEWEKYLHEDPHDRLVQLAIAHAEFESLHPFLDGNGRLGRMLIPLFLWQHRLIHRPMFYLSAYLEQRRDEYYERLLGVSRDGDWTAWCVFFLSAVRSQAQDNLTKAQAMLSLYDELKPVVVAKTHSQYSIATLDWIFGNPIFSASHFVARAGIPPPTAKRILRVLREERLLRTLREGSGRRAAIYSCPRILNIAEGYDAF